MNFWEWLRELFEAIFKPKKPDIEIKVCLDNPTSTPIQARDDCPRWETRKYVKGTVLAVCEMDHNEYVKHIICLDSLPGLKLKNQYCKRVEERRFMKGQEPTEVCKIHRKPKPVYPPRIEDLHCGLGSFFWFLRIAWSLTGRADAIKQLDAFLHELRMRGVYANKFFCWLQTRKAEHAHLVGKMPYESKNFVTDLDTWNSNYWDLYRIFIDRHVAHEIEPIVNPMMRKNYCGLPYENIGGFWSDAAQPYMRRLFKKYCEETVAIAGTNFMVKPANEFHHRNKEQFHRNGLWHKDMIDNVILKYLPIHRVIIDNSKSEGCQIYENEILLCGKPYIEGETHGNPSHERKDPLKSVLAETHGVSILENLTGDSEKLNYLKSKWTRYLLDEDCGGGDNARGYRIGGFRFADADQTEEMLRHGVGAAHAKGKRFIFSIFFPGFNLDLGAYIEDYSVDNIGRPEINGWERLDRTQKVYYEILGL